MLWTRRQRLSCCAMKCINSRYSAFPKEERSAAEVVIPSPDGIEQSAIGGDKVLCWR